MTQGKKHDHVVFQFYFFEACYLEGRWILVPIGFKELFVDGSTGHYVDGVVQLTEIIRLTPQLYESRIQDIKGLTGKITIQFEDENHFEAKTNFDVKQNCDYTLHGQKQVVKYIVLFFFFENQDVLSS